MSTYLKVHVFFNLAKKHFGGLFNRENGGNFDVGNCLTVGSMVYAEFNKIDSQS